MTPRRLSGFSLSGFSLVELLVVVALIGLLSVFSVTAFNSIVRAGRVEQAVGTVAGSIELARLEAGAKSRPVEIRFYQSNSSAPFHAMQLFLLKDSGMDPLTPVTRLPDGVGIAADAKSSLLQSGDLQSGTGSSGVASGWKYLSFEIAADGETSLTPGNGPFYLAIGQERALTNGSDSDLFAVFVDPVTGKTRVAGQ